MAHLIIPAEVKICATCSYWCGDRKVDPELGVVVIDAAVEGECLVRDCGMEGLLDVRGIHDCPWEHIAPDED